jgi:hypothetical protein
MRETHQPALSRLPVDGFNQLKFGREARLKPAESRGEKQAPPVENWWQTGSRLKAD